MEEKQTNFKINFWYYIFILLEIGIVLIYVFLSEYTAEVSANGNQEDEENSAQWLMKGYAFYQDIHVMIFVGFGFLMTFLKTSSWTAVSFNFFISAFCIQIGILIVHFWHNVLGDDGWTKVHLNLDMLVEGDFAAASVLVGFGAVLGKVSAVQLVIMALMQVTFYGLNLKLGLDTFGVFDIGGSMHIHQFGAFFGCAVSKVITDNDKVRDNKRNAASYSSNMFSFIGTIFLFMYWPSFNGYFSSGNQMHRVVVNTVLSLTATNLAVFLLAPIFNEGKLDMEDVLNATVAGGVSMGCVADVITNAWGSLIIGASAGTISIFGYRILSPWLHKHDILYDTCGVLNLHGLPGLFGGLVGAIAGYASHADTLALSIGREVGSIVTGDQGSNQFYSLLCTIGISISSGILTGYLMKLFKSPEVYFDDEQFWAMEQEEHDELERKITTRRTTHKHTDSEANEIKKVVEAAAHEEKSHEEKPANDQK